MTIHYYCLISGHNSANQTREAGLFIYSISIHSEQTLATTNQMLWLRVTVWEIIYHSFHKMQTWTLMESIIVKPSDSQPYLILSCKQRSFCLKIYSLDLVKIYFKMTLEISEELNCGIKLKQSCAVNNHFIYLYLARYIGKTSFFTCYILWL